MTANWTEVLDTDFDYTGIDIYRRLKDGAFWCYVAKAQDGYVFYDPTAQDTAPVTDPMTGMMIEHPTTNYYTIRVFACNYDMSNFCLLAAPLAEVESGVFVPETVATIDDYQAALAEMGVEV